MPKTTATKATKATKQKPAKQPAQPSHQVAIWPYWPHILIGFFGAIFILFGIGMIDGSLANARQGFEASDWKQGVGMIIFASMLVGVAINKIALLYHRGKAAK